MSKERYHAVETPQADTAKLLLARIRAGDLDSGFTAKKVYRKCWHGLTDPTAVKNACSLLVDYGWLVAIEAPPTRSGVPDAPVAEGWPMSYLERLQKKRPFPELSKLSKAL